MLDIAVNNQEIVVYADLNCPFCFALHERLTSLNLMGYVDWRSIEHAPKITFNVNDYQMQSELTHEVTRVRKLAPDVTIMVPPARPNSHFASELVTEINKIYPDKSSNLRSLIYRALWVDGKDLGQQYILEEILRDACIPKPQISLTSMDKLHQWQQEWEQGDFSRNIPALVTHDGNKLLGLPSKQILEAFQLAENLQDDIDSDAVCQARPVENILVATSDANYQQNLAQLFQNEYRVSFAANSREVFKACGSDEPPDLVIMDVDIKESDGFTTCLILKERESSHNIPVVLLSRNTQVEQELHAFDNGASEFMATPYDDNALKARVQKLLRTKRTNDLLEQFARLDSLTELANHREYERTIEKEWSRAVRANNPISLILIDIDHFKSYNQHYGLLKGDECIIKVAQIIKEGFKRPTDTIARYSGEKFVAILPNTNEEGALKLASNINQALELLGLHHEYAPNTQQITVSQGIATIEPSLSLQPKTLFEAADTALREAKHTGRNNIVCNTI